MTSYYPYATPYTMDSYNGADLGSAMTNNAITQWLASYSNAAEASIAAWGQQVQVAIENNIATCEQVNAYNEAARQLYQTQYKMAVMLTNAGWADRPLPYPLPLYGRAVTPWPVQGPDFVVDTGCTKWSQDFVTDCQLWYIEPGWKGAVERAKAKLQAEGKWPAETGELGAVHAAVWYGVAIVASLLAGGYVIQQLKRDHVEEMKGDLNSLIFKTAAAAASQYNDCMEKNGALVTTLDKKIELMQECKKTVGYNPDDYARPSKSWGFTTWLLVIGGVGVGSWLLLKGYREYQARGGMRKVGRLGPQTGDDYAI